MAINLAFDPPLGPTLAWAEHNPGGDSGHAGTFGTGSPSSFAYPIVVNFSDWISGPAIRTIMGYSSKGAGNTLTRKLPMQCPYHPTLYASRFSQVKFEGYNGKVLDGRTGGARSDYQYAIPTILFEAPQYSVLADGSITSGDPVTGEQSRFVQRRIKTSVQNIQREYGAFNWGPGTPQAGKPVDVRQGQRILERRLTWTWLQLPDNGLFSGGGSVSGGVASKLDAAVGCVNNAAFFGYATETLLFEDYEVEPWTVPFDASVVNLGGATVPLIWNAILYFVEFDPPNGLAQRGHNLAPDPSNGKWYPFFAQDGTTKLYPTTDFTQIFLMN